MQQQYAAQQQIPQSQQPQQPQQPRGQGGFGSGAQQQSGGLFGASNAANYNPTPFGSSSAVNPSSGSNHALQDYQTQMLLLEQQNQNRMRMVHEEQETKSKAGGNGGDDAETIIPDLPTLSTQESEWNESVCIS